VSAASAPLLPNLLRLCGRAEEQLDSIRRPRRNACAEKSLASVQIGELSASAVAKTGQSSGSRLGRRVRAAGSNDSFVFEFYRLNDFFKRVQQ
jgi:hypothetical protein